MYESMILWLASYPKSGNTMLRSLIAAYFFTKDGNFNFEALGFINQFPDVKFFKNLEIDIYDDTEVTKNYIKAQQEINKKDKNSMRFLKTHSTLHDIGGNKFTDLHNSLGAIYIVRDPRNVVKSYANHNQMNLDIATNALKSFRVLGGNRNASNDADRIRTHVGSWSSHYNTWKVFDKLNKYLLVKYEDLVKDTEKTFIQILNFIYKLNNVKLIIDKKKLQNAIKTTSFKNLQSLEEKMNFPEAVKDQENNSVKFFKYGPKNDGKESLPKELKKIIEDSFVKEMKELNYLV